jgi:hypothetical protein
MSTNTKTILRIAALILKESKLAAQARALRQEVTRLNRCRLYYTSHTLNTDAGGTLELTVELQLYLELVPAEPPQVAPIPILSSDGTEYLPPTHARLAYPAVRVGELDGRAIMIRAWSDQFALPTPTPTQPEPTTV